MKSIHNLLGIKESILSSTGTGLKTKIENWVENHHFNSKWTNDKATINDDMTLSFENLDIRYGLTQIPCPIKSVLKNVHLEKYEGESFTIPFQCGGDVDLIESKSLKIIDAKQEGSCKRFQVVDCKEAKLDESLKNCVFEKVYIQRANIDTIDFFKNISKSLQIILCSKLKSVNLDLPTTKFYAELCGISDINNSKFKSIDLSSCNKLKSVHLVNSTEELILENCPALTEVILEQPVNTLVIKNCEKLKIINVKCVNEDMSLSKLPALESVEVEDAKNAIVSLAKLPIEPKIEAKKISIR